MARQAAWAPCRARSVRFRSDWRSCGIGPRFPGPRPIKSRLGRETLTGKENIHGRRAFPGEHRLVRRLARAPRALLDFGVLIPTRPIAVLASGQGSNFEVLVLAAGRGELPGRIALLLCDVPG